MKITYGILRETHLLSSDPRVSYGIAAYSDVRKNGSACVLFAAHDLSASQESLEAFTDRLNREKASLHHFEELIADFLATV